PGLNAGRRRNLLHSGLLWQGKCVVPLPASGASRYVVWSRKSLPPRKADMTRADAVARARGYLHSGEFLRDLDRRVAYQTESQNPERRECLRAYLEAELQPAFAQLDFSTRLIESPTGNNPYLLAQYRENSSAPTVLMYGHGDLVDGMAGERRDDRNPDRATNSGNHVNVLDTAT